MYGVAGVLTMIINLAADHLCYSVVGVPNVWSTIAAWALAVSFAVITNKLWVFKSRDTCVKVVVYELAFFNSEGHNGHSGYCGHVLLHRRISLECHALETHQQ